MGEKGSEITSAEEILSRVDYSLWFTDAICQQYAAGFPKRISNSANTGEKDRILEEADCVMTLYSVLVYDIYPLNKEFKQTIDSNSELSSNFRNVKEWLDQNNGEKTAAEFMAQMEAEG